MKGKYILILLTAFITSLTIVYGLLTYTFNSSSNTAYFLKQAAGTAGLKQPQVVGFLPYWLLGKADKDYAQYLTTLTYFGLVIEPNGSIQEFTNPGEAEPGLYALKSGKVDPFLNQAREKNIRLSLLAFQGKPSDIHQLISDPVSHANTLMDQVAPIMKQYGFTDLNIDIESVADASESARQNFTSFIKTVSERLDAQRLGTLTIDSSPSDLIKTRLIDLKAVEPFVDTIVLMTYDYHYMGSSVTGPVSPSRGAGVESEFDVETGVQKALEVIPREKILLGIPLYGYRWESITDTPRSATLPGSGLVVSNRFMEDFLKECATCSAQIDKQAQELYVIYKHDSGTYYQAFFPDINFLYSKLQLATQYHVDGVALWAIGYEGNNILEPLKQYKQTVE